MNTTTNQMLATLTPGQAVTVSNWAKDWLPELQAMSREAYTAALQALVAQVKAGRAIQRR